LDSSKGWGWLKWLMYGSWFSFPISAPLLWFCKDVRRGMKRCYLLDCPMKAIKKTFERYLTQNIVCLTDVGRKVVCKRAKSTKRVFLILCLFSWLLKQGEFKEPSNMVSNLNSFTLISCHWEEVVWFISRYNENVWDWDRNRQ